jgi:hypothetical protein
MLCGSCDTLVINGLLCHERGCPDKWKTEKRECRWCGQTFEPEMRYQETCSHSCNMAYNNVSCDCEECNPKD